MSEPAIELDDVSLSFRKGDDRVAALDGLSLRVERGERLAIIGPSGSGKSSLVRVVGGLEEPDEGAVRVAGHRLDERTRSRDLARKVGVVFQNQGLVPQLTALQNTLCGRLYRYEGHRGLFQFDEGDRREAAAWLDRFGLGDRLHQRAQKLSGGEKQRVAISKLLLQAPDIALLDEPVSNLDVHWAAEAMRELDAVGGGDSTVVTVLHDLAAVREWFDRAVLVRNGSIVFDGSPQEACRRLQSLGPPGSRSSGDTGPPRTSTPGSSRATPDDDGGGEAPPNPALSPAARSSSGVSNESAAAAVAEPEFSGEIPQPDGRLFYFGIGGVVLALLAWAGIGIEVSPRDLFGGLGSAGEFLSRLYPPDTSVAGTVFDSLVETIQMALIGTTLAAGLSLPISVMAARNVSPGPLRAVARVVLNALRTIPSIIWGLFFVAMVGLGPLPGILALTFYASGYLGKFYYEGIESIAPEPVRALRAVGASRLQQFRHGVFPQVLPLLVGYTLYMFEYNVRAASILGIVGAGGIGFYLYTYINNFEYTKATTALLMLLAVVTVIDVASSRLRRRLQA